jgi:hypothetical protein
MPSNSQRITIKLPDNTSVDHANELFAYVLNSNGKVVETAPFKGREARLGASKDILKGSRVFIGSGFPGEYPESKIDAYALAASGAYQLSMNFNTANEIAVQRLPTNIGVEPILHFCEVQGNVTNNLVLNGVPQNGPVCKAKVHICTVDWYFRWPIWLRPVVPATVVDSLKDLIAGLQANPIPGRGPQEIPAHVEDAILAATPETIHETVRAHAEILYPYFCAWPVFWPWFYRVVEQEVVYTDCSGHYEGWLVSVGAPAPENIYVWVEASIGGAWVSVYNPPFPCHTYWNYACGTEINISLNDASIPPCNCDSTVVDGSAWFTAIGGYGIASNIQQEVASSSLGIRNVGCTNLFDSNQLCPFGGSLGLYLAFGPTLPASHYRWSWTYVLDSATNPITGAPTNPITGAVQRYYLWPLPDDSWESGSIPLLDTDADGNIAYLIPNYDVTTYPGVSALAEWVSFNFLSASLDSTKIANGYVVRFDLELMNKNAADVFEVVSVPDVTFQISVDTNAAAAYDGSVAAPAAYLTPDPSTPGNALAFSMLVRVDNSAVTAQIDDTVLLDFGGGVATSGQAGPCGVIQFTSPVVSSAPQSVDLSFIASEPFNFATFSYAVSKGDSGSSLVSASGYVFESTASFTLASGVFSDVVSVATLLGSCPSAAFAETLSVDSLATDGNGLLSETGAPYSAFEQNAFALTPALPTP